MNIDWSKAPEWAVAHGLNETGLGIKEFWLGETQHQQLEHARPFPYGGGDRSLDSFHNSRRGSFSYVTERPAPWSGKGLPPVGTVCEHGRLIDGEWVTVEVIAHRKFQGCGFVSAVYVYDGGVGHASPGKHFRPIRTPEQIAEEARVAELNLMIGAIKDYPGGRHGVDHLTQLMIHEEVCIDLYAAGWRKQVAE